MKDFDLRKYLAEGKLLKEGEYTYMNDTNTEFGPDVLDLDYDKIRAYISTKKGDDFADNFIDGYNDNFYENVVRFFDKIENPTDEEVLNFIDIEIEKYLAEGKLLKEEFVKGTPQYYVKYTTQDGEEVKSELMSKREAIYKERDLVDSGVKKSSVHKIQKNMDLNGKEYEIEYELDKDIEYRTDEEGKPIHR